MYESNGFILRFGDVVTLFIYFLATLSIGIYCAKKTLSTSGYFEGAHSIPGWAVCISMIGTSISSVTFLAYPGSAYSGDWSYLLPNLLIPIGAFVGMFYFVPFYRRTGFTTSYEFLEKRYGCNWLRTYGSSLFLLGTLWRLGSILYLISLAISTLTGWSIFNIIIVLGVFITLYTVMGGIEAVIWTDVMQTIILLFGGICVIGIIMYKIDGGMFHILKEGIREEKFHIAYDFSPVLNKQTFWILMISGLFGTLCEFAGDQTKIQRYHAASSDQSAKVATFFAGIACIPFWVMFMYVGTCLWVFYHTINYSQISGLKSDQIFPYFIVTEMPSGVSGFVLSAVIAAAISSLDSSMNSFGKVFTHDLYARLFARNKEDHHYLNVARNATSVGGALMIVAAWLTTLLNSESLLYVGYVIGSVLGGGFGGVFLLAFFSKRANSKGAAVGIISAVLVSLYLTLSYFDILAIKYETDQRIEEQTSYLVESGLMEEYQLLSNEDKQTYLQGIYSQISPDEKGFRFIPEFFRIDIHPIAIGVVTMIQSILVTYFASFLFLPLTPDEDIIFIFEDSIS